MSFLNNCNVFFHLCVAEYLFLQQLALHIELKIYGDGVLNYIAKIPFKETVYLPLDPLKLSYLPNSKALHNVMTSTQNSSSGI